jgi:hypothetical protein
MIMNQLKGHEKAHLERRHGVHQSVRDLLRRAGIDILDPGEDCHITETRRNIPLQDGSSYEMVFRVVDKLFFPITSYRG